jgi:hypothetical protein
MILNCGDSIRGHVRPHNNNPFANPFTALYSKQQEPLLYFTNFDSGISGYIRPRDVRVTCVPRMDPFVDKYFPGLPELEYEP